MIGVPEIAPILAIIILSIFAMRAFEEAQEIARKRDLRTAIPTMIQAFTHVGFIVLLVFRYLI